MRKEITFNQTFRNMLNMIRFRKITWQNQSATDWEDSIWSHYWAVAEWWVIQTETEISANLEFENVFWRSSSEWSSRAYFSPCLRWSHTYRWHEWVLPGDLTCLLPKLTPLNIPPPPPPRPSPTSPSRLVASMSIKYPAIRLITCNFPCFLNQLKTPIPRLADN